MPDGVNISSWFVLSCIALLRRPSVCGNIVCMMCTVVSYVYFICRIWNGKKTNAMSLWVFCLLLLWCVLYSYRGRYCCSFSFVYVWDRRYHRFNK
jgi:hypothetical protein